VCKLHRRKGLDIFKESSQLLSARSEETAIISSEYKRNVDSDLKAEHPEYGVEVYHNVPCFVNRFVYV
jgi:hypothetical protein